MVINLKREIVTIVLRETRLAITREIDKTGKIWENFMNRQYDDVWLAVMQEIGVGRWSGGAKRK